MHIKTDTEKELLRRTGAGDAVAFAQLFEQYRDKVFSAAWKITGIRAAAEDAVQDIFLKVWMQRDKLTEINSFTAWLHTLTKHHIYNELRKVAYEHTFLKEMLAEETTDTFQQVSFHELQDMLHRAVSQLPPQQQRVYLLSREEGLKYHEIAERLQIAPSTVKTHMIEALRTLKQQLRNNGVVITLPVVIMMGATAVIAQA